MECIGNGDFGADFVDFGPKMRLFAAYEDADDLKSRLKISAEVRLLEQSAARLVSADQNGPSGDSEHTDGDSSACRAGEVGSGEQCRGLMTATSSAVVRFACLACISGCCRGNARGCRKPDPRWRRGEPAPPEWMVKSRHLSHLEAGEPVRLASWELGGRSEPDERIYRLRQDRSITGWTVTPNDEVIPERGFDAED